MRVLIVQSSQELGEIWQSYLAKRGNDVLLAQTQSQAVAILGSQDIDLMVLDIVLETGGALAVADYASYRHPNAKIIFVSSTGFFSDGSIFQHVANACAVIPADAPVGDLAAMVDHYGAKNPLVSKRSA